jgi:hypothetical protein
MAENKHSAGKFHRSVAGKALASGDHLHWRGQMGFPAKSAAYADKVSERIDRVQKSFEKARKGGGTFGLKDAK